MVSESVSPLRQVAGAPEVGADGERVAAAPGTTVQIVDHALMVLHAIAEADRPRGVRELSRDLMISKSSTQRILTSLERVGLAVFDEESRRYEIGPAALTLAWKYAANSDLVSASREIAQSIAATTGETACVSTLVGDRRVTVYEAESTQPLRLITGVGRPYSPLQGATGRALLALLDEGGLERVTAESEEGDTLTRRVAEARTAGYAVSRGEWIEGACGVAVPVGVRGGTVAALSIYGPAVRLTDERVAELLPSLREGAHQIAIRWRQG
ncbi:IclR family transcriptional regulator [Sinosporangium siamense]|uniref:IclR family transcriptional regulator n=1 Tax=Sinosporangium siamense TaxID=1367973 RepID=A0A919V4P1_9ACTN|nr:IclR family transcriptional regulator [Sinosporangium siamense]GII92130.1 IclR family transcriptional regulator [Sinosporangium siamense]